MANLQGSKDILEGILKDLSSEISSQVRAKRGNQNAIETYLEQIDETIMFEIGNMINATEQADKEAIQAWIEDANKKSKEMLNRYKGRNTSVDAALKNSQRTFTKNQSNTVWKEMEKAGNEEGAYKREDFATRYQKNEDAIKKAEDMEKKAKEVEKIKGNNTPHRLQKNFTNTTNKEYENWKKRINNIKELSKDNFTKEDVEDILNDLSYDIKDAIAKSTKGIPKDIKNDFEKLRVNLEKIDLNDAYNTDLIKETKDAIRDILVYDEDKLKTKTLNDLERVVNKISEEAIRKNLTEKALEISDPKKAKERANEKFINKIDQYGDIFPEENKAIEKLVRREEPGISDDDRNKKIEEKFAQMAKDIFDAARTDERTESIKIRELKLRKRELDQEKAQVKKYEAVEKEHNDFKDIEEMARGELDELSDEVTDLEAETNRLETRAMDLNEEVTRLENEYMGLAMELAEDEDKRRQLEQAQLTRQNTVDPTKLDLEDLGFSKEFQLQKGGFIGGTPTYHDFVSEDVSQRSGRNQDGDNLIDEIYNQLKKESGFANVAEKLKLNGYTEIKEVKHPRLFKMWASIRSHIPKLKNTDSRREAAIKDALTKEIEKRITALRDAHTAAQSAPIPDIDIMSDDDRLAKERAYEAHETLLQTAEENFNEAYERYTNTYNDYNEKKEDFEGKAVIYNDIRDKYNARKASFEESLKLQGEDKAKFMANEQKAIYKTVNDGKRVDAESVRDEAEGEEIDI